MKRKSFFWQLVERFEEKLDVPFEIKLCQMKNGDIGECRWTGKRYIIKVDRKASLTSKTDTLLHELAHAVSWRKEADDHGEEWGIAYSLLYRMYVKFLKIIEKEEK